LPTATAARLLQDPDSDGFPSSPQWRTAAPIRFNSDWQGKNPDPQRETEVRLLWSPQTLFLQFRAHFRTITVFADAEPSGRRDHLWDRDVAEVFLQPDASDPQRYLEFEISPNGTWLDLALNHGARQDLHSSLRRRVSVDHPQQIWIADLAIPMKSLTLAFDPAATWRINFFRVEGPAEPRFYSAWSPTHTPVPNFHIPPAFGTLIFTPASA
jgi:alpha-galactosidase